ncbi:sulfotransferase family protein [Methylomonas sp. LL1]|uniref:hypothetical protein n=1 Tax=Methylomonas sp. LL1 TaxID=2785785 RepID=UPI0018C41E0D|nr:hypothetical protein [Methylomonas sp. LL1]QPK65306.1 sulfotransferase family protein [Methylomonas sp. LL1]
MINQLKKHCFLLTKKARHSINPCPVEKRQSRLIAGAQRSGTNLVMDILENDWDTDVYHERDPRAFDNYVMRPIGEIQALREKSQSPKFVIKALCESQNLDAIMSALAPSKAAWVVRHYSDVIKSMQISFPTVLNRLRLIANDKEDGQWVSDGMSDDTYQLLLKLIDQLDTPSACAFQWYLRNILFFEKGFDQNPNIKIIFYENLISSPETTTRELFDFFDLKYAPSVHNMINSPSSRKNHSIKLLPEVEQLCDRLWQRFLAAAPSAAIS